MITSFEIPAQDSEYAAFKAANPVHKLRWNGATIDVMTGDDMSPVLTDDMKKLGELFKSKK